MFFQNTFIPRVVALAVGCGLVIGSGCDGIGDDPPGDPNAEAAEKVVTDLSVIRSQGERLTAMIEDGEAVETVLQSLVESLAVEPRVESAALDADGRRVETVFKSGMNHAFVVIDEAEQLAIPDETVEETVVPKASAKVAEVDDVTGGRLFQESRVWFPASNKALIATSSTVVDPIYGEEVRDLFEKMLKDRGYDVKPKEATVELFKSLTQYGVIILITTPNGTKWVTTTTPVPTDAESLRPYAKDLLEKRLALASVISKVAGKKPVWRDYFTVSPDFVRHYATGDFPDRTFLYSLCSPVFTVGYTDAEGPWANLLHEKCKGEYVIGWVGSPPWTVAARAGLTLLQELTGSNLEYSLGEFVCLKKRVPPGGAVDTGWAWNVLDLGRMRTYQDKKQSCTLFFQEDPDIAISTLALVPDIHELWIAPDSRMYVDGLLEDNCEVHIGGAVGNIGAYDVHPTAGRPHVPLPSLIEGWSFNMPAGAFGEMYGVLPDGRRGPSRTVLAWKPSFVITGPMGDGGYTITYLAYVRCMVPWHDPVFAYLRQERVGAAELFLDESATIVTWQVKGKYEDDEVLITYEGGDSQNITRDPLHTFGGLADGETGSGWLNFQDTTSLEYTETKVDKHTGEVTKTKRRLGGGVDLPDLVFDATNWTIRGETRPWGDGTIRWNDCEPSPPFDVETTLR
ncbi:MAG: hypothetical protein GXY33_00900 [Phycisphaerae bacterium]|nr:hypothetical protein [Phycisphaerae bacterium]